MIFCHFHVYFITKGQFWSHINIIKSSNIIGGKYKFKLAIIIKFNRSIYMPYFLRPLYCQYSGCLFWMEAILLIYK